MRYISFSRMRDEVLHARTPPKITAASMAVGVGLAFSPFPGVHLLVAFIVSKLFRLNPVVVVVGSLIHNPWTMLPIHLFGLMVGDMMLYGHLESVDLFRAFPWSDLGFSTLFSAGFWSQHGHLFLSLLRPFFLGSLAVSGVLAAVAYKATRKALRYAAPAIRRRQLARRKAAAEREA